MICIKKFCCIGISQRQIYKNGSIKDLCDGEINVRVPLIAAEARVWTALVGG